METLSLLWSFAPDIKIKLLYLALIGQMIITILAYSRMAKARIAAVKAERVDRDMYKATTDEPEDVRVFTRAVANQFELPVLFYVIVLAMLVSSVTSWITVILAWAFIVLRYVHFQEMTTTNTVLKRRKTFIRGTQTIMLMMAELVVATLIFVQA